MDTVILAAGENVRLQVAGIPPGKKPLLMCEGEVLIRRLCRQVRADRTRGLDDRIVIVTSPGNTEDIAFATREFSPHIVVQLDAIGPTHALDLGLELTRSNRVMLLMADNFIKDWYDNAGYTPTVSVVLSNDHALHPISGDGFFIRDEDTLIRWLGPLTFHKDMYTPEAKSWVEAFDNIEFELLHHEGNVKDMGVV